jgi:hypothetical protein
MTHRPNEPYTLKSLDLIQQIKATNDSTTGAVASGTDTNFPFYEFKMEYIDATTLNNFTRPPTGVPPGLHSMIDGVGFLDSLHDFKSDFMDCQAPIKGNKEIFSFKKFGFSFLLNGGYPTLLPQNNLLIQQAYSYLNRIPRPLNESNLENYFSLGNIYDIINNPDRGQMYILPNTRAFTPQTKEKHFQNIYNKLTEFFSEYRDGNFGNTIKVIVDHQLNFYDIVYTCKPKDDATPSDFSILYTAETITDPAPKSKAKKLDDNFGYKNCYIENLPGSRTYNASVDGVGGNVNVTFSNLVVGTSDLENGRFFVDVVYQNGDRREPVKVEMNSKGNSINAIKNQIRNTIERVTGVVADTFTSTFYNESITDRRSFYNNFNQGMNDGTKRDYTQKYAIFYARKRLGDTLQARICLPDKLSNLNFNSVKRESGTFTGYNFKLDTTTPKRASTGAVLVTHDRMLFSYAVIQGIPTILDLENNMIVFLPRSPPQGPRVPPGLRGGFQQIVPKINTYNFNKNPTNLIQKGGEDANDIVESIMNNPDALIRFLYFYVNGRSNFSKLDGFKIFMDNVNRNFNNSNNTLDYAYLGEFLNNTLVISPRGDIEGIIYEINEPIITGVQTREQIKNQTYDLIQNSVLIHIRLDDNNYIEVKKSIKDAGITISKSKYNGTLESNGINLSKQQIKSQINNPGSFTINTQNTDVNASFANNITEDLLSNDAKTTSERVLSVLCNVIIGGVVGGVVGGITGIMYGNPYDSIVTGAAFGAVGTSVFEGAKYKGFLGGGKPSDIPLYESVLTVDFSKLNDPKNLFQNNVTVIYFLFNLLRSYELSFITYQEGIESFYTKIDESCVLSDMIGVTNWIPHNIEFYVFLKLILQDYSEKNVNTINYALFEYYLYLLKGVNNIYYRFQDVKSYLLNTNYEIPFTPQIQSAITTTNMQSLQYFNSVCKRAMQISQDVITKNYNASQSANFDLIHNNADAYGLKLCGFTEMKSEFINKTVDIVSSMMSKGLLLKYKNSNKEGTSSQDDYTSPSPNMPDAAGIQSNTVMMQTPIAALGGKKVATSLRKKRRNKNNSKKRRKIYKRKQQTMKKVSKRRKTHRK